MESLVAVERKGGIGGVADLYGTLGQGRERFERELRRMAEMSFAAVVIEASFAKILTAPPPQSRLNPKSVLRSIFAWMQRYHVHFVPCEDRRMAEVATFRLLQRFFLDRQAKG
jgi:hypothetical protein